MNTLYQIERFARLNREFPNHAPAVLQVLAEGLVPRSGELQTDLAKALNFVRSYKVTVSRAKENEPDESPWERTMKRIASLYDEAEARA